MRKQTEETLRQCVLIPVLRTSSPELAEKALQCLLEAGLAAVEITMTVPNCCELIAKANQMGFCAGAGTVFSTACAKQCIDAGAKFIVSPVVVDGLSELCHEADVCCIMGAVTPNEVCRAISSGADVVKIFPASIGGAGYLKALRDIFPDTPFCPTGGISPANIADFRRAGASFLGAGGSLFDFASIEAGESGKAVSRMRDFVNALQTA